MECSDDLIEARYRDETTGRFDGVHMYGFFGKRAFSRNLIRIMNTDTKNYYQTNLITTGRPKKMTPFTVDVQKKPS